MIAATPPKLLIVTSIFPPDDGGPATYVASLLRALPPRLDILGVVTLAEADISAETDAPEDGGWAAPIHRIRRSMPRLIRVPYTIAKIWWAARRADVVYLNGLVFEGIIATKILRRRPAIVKVVGDLIWERASLRGATNARIEAFQTGQPEPWRFLHRLQSWYMRRADRIITPSAFLAGIVTGWVGHKGKIEIIYNSVAFSEIQSENDRMDCDVLTIARLVPWKGLEALIELAGEHGWRLDILGEGPLRPALERQIAALPAPQNIRLIGRVPPDRVAAHLAGARCFVLNSTYEGLPHVVLEAMAAGTPVVATKVGGTPELIADGITGRLVEAGDKAALSRAISDILSSGGAAMAAAARDRVRDEFSFEQMISRTADALLRQARSRVDA